MDVRGREGATEEGGVAATRETAEAEEEECGCARGHDRSAAKRVALYGCIAAESQTPEDVRQAHEGADGREQAVCT